MIFVPAPDPRLVETVGHVYSVVIWGFIGYTLARRVAPRVAAALLGEAKEPPEEEPPE